MIENLIRLYRHHSRTTLSYEPTVKSPLSQPSWVKYKLVVVSNYRQRHPLGRTLPSFANTLDFRMSRSLPLLSRPHQCRLLGRTKPTLDSIMLLHHLPVPVRSLVSSPRVLCRPRLGPQTPPFFLPTTALDPGRKAWLESCLARDLPLRSSPKRVWVRTPSKLDLSPLFPRWR